MVQRIGYRYTGKLKSWLHNVLGKAPLSKYRLATKPGLKVKKDAEILIENLCIIYAFKSIFLKNKKDEGDKEFRPFKDLESGDYKKHIEKDASKERKKLINNREEITSALANLDKFFAAVKSIDGIDITKQSLAELMANVKSVEGIYDFDPTTHACVIGLSNLRYDIAKSPNDHVLYRKMAELLYEMGQLEDSLDQIEECLELDPDNGIAWAIKAKILLEQLEEKRRSQKLNSHSLDSSPYTSAMTTSAIEWMFTEDHFGYDLNKELRREFVNSAFKALEFWPTRKPTLPCVDHCHDKAQCPNDYLCETALYSTDELPDCESTIARDWMFFHLVQNIKLSEIQQHESAFSLPKILESFRSTEDRNAFPNPYFLKDSPDPDEKIAFLQKLTLLIKEVSPEEHNALMEAFVHDLKKDKHHASRNLKTLTYSPLTNALWDHLGPKKYAAMHKLLWKYVKESEAEEHFGIIAVQALRTIRTPLDEPTTMYTQYSKKFMLQHWDDNWGPKFPDHSREAVMNVFSKGIMEAHTSLKSLEGMIDYDQLFTTNSPEDFCSSYRGLVPLVALIEYNLTGNQMAKQRLDILTNKPDIAKFCFGSNDALLMQMFEECWQHEKTHTDSPNPIKFFKAIGPLCK